MPDIHNLPANVQLQIYDLFLALRTYKREGRLHTVCGIIMEDIKQADESDDYIDYVNISNTDEIDVLADEEMRGSLPEVILNGYYLIDHTWSVIMDWGCASLKRCFISLDDGEEDIQVLRLNLGNDDWGWEAIYDIYTFQCLMSIYNYKCMSFENNDIVDVMKISLEDCAERAFEYNDLGLEQYRQWLNETTEKNYPVYTFSDEFTKMRSLLYEKFSSHLLISSLLKQQKQRS